MVSGHPNEDLVASVSIPEAGQEARIVEDFFALVPPQELYDLRLDTLVGIWEMPNYGVASLWQQFYDVDSEDVNRKSFYVNGDFYQLGLGNIKKHAGYLTHHEDSFWVGRSDGAGNVQVQHGPSLYKVNDDFSLQPFPIPAREDWNAKDRYKAIFFAEDHVFWLVAKATGTVWYGTPIGPNGEVDTVDDAKGYHTDKREVWLLPYTWPELEPRDPIPLPEFHESAKCGGLGYDTSKKRLYIHEAWPPQQDQWSFPWERPRIHMYDIGSVIAPTDPDEGLKARIEINGQIYEGFLFRSGIDA